MSFCYARDNISITKCTEINLFKVQYLHLNGGWEIYLEKSITTELSAILQNLNFYNTQILNFLSNIEKESFVILNKIRLYFRGFY